MVDILDKLMRMGVPDYEVVLRADPEPGPRPHPLISVDDHYIEGPDTFTGRLPSKLQAIGPRIEREGDVDYWIFEDQRVPLLGVEGIQGWEPGQGHPGPITFEKFRPGIWQVEARVKDMEVNGVIGSCNFPSAIFGFAGQRFMRMNDRELGLASMRAYNDWIFEEWYSPHPDRFIPSQITWLHDVEIAAAEIYKNAERGFTAVAFSENPEKLGLPSINSGYWAPFFRACQETDTVINLHVGSSSQTMFPSTDSDPAVLGVLFPVNGFAASHRLAVRPDPGRVPEPEDRPVRRRDRLGADPARPVELHVPAR